MKVKLEYSKKKKACGFCDRDGRNKLKVVRIIHPAGDIVTCYSCYRDLKKQVRDARGY